MRALRRTEEGKPSVVTRVIAVMLVLGLVAAASPALLRGARWLVAALTAVAL